MVMAHAVMIALTVGIHPHGLRIFFVQPGGTRAAGGGQNRIDAVLVEGFDPLVQPVKLIPALLGFQHGPGEDAHGDAVDTRLLHKLDILLEDFGVLHPLIRVVVAAMEHGRDFVK